MYPVNIDCASLAKKMVEVGCADRVERVMKIVVWAQEVFAEQLMCQIHHPETDEPIE